MGSPASRFLRLILGICAIALASMTAIATPLVPIVSFLQHWDHHWYVWLPSDPVYEAVEIMAAERGPTRPPLLWVFFTERAVPKHQINYYNDAQFAAARAAAGTTAQFADIRFRMTGAEGEPRGVAVEFVDSQNRPVTIGIDFAAGAKLGTVGAGLTDQIGHSSERLLLLFFREKAARTPDPHVTIDGVDVAKLPPGESYPAPFAAAYSSNIFVGGFLFIGMDVSFDDRTETTPWGARFAPTATPGIYEATPPYSGRVNLLARADGRLAGYQQHDRTGAHTIDIRFDPPLPPADDPTSETTSAFQISLDDFHDLLAGSIGVRCDGGNILIDWRFDRPAWARSRVLRTTAVVGGAGITHIDLRPLKND
jgi:hypothetical protein